MKEEMVNHPKHYNSGKYEVIDVIEDWKLGFNLGNAVKYIARCEHKGKKSEDLDKALWYLQREIGKKKSTPNYIHEKSDDNPFEPPCDGQVDLSKPLYEEFDCVKCVYHDDLYDACYTCDDSACNFEPKKMRTKNESIR